MRRGEEKASGAARRDELTSKDLNYVVELMRRLAEERGAVVAVRTWKLCRDKRCVMRMRKVLMRLVEMGLATRLRRRGLYLIKREDVGKAIEALRALMRL